MANNYLAPCIHEEADTHFFYHVAVGHAILEGSKKLTIKANDTDVLVIVFLQELGLCKMWMISGQGSNLRMIAVHNIASED